MASFGTHAVGLFVRNNDDETCLDDDQAPWSRSLGSLDIDYHYSSDKFDLSDYSTGYMSGQSVPVSGGLRPQGIFAQHGNHSHTYTGSRSYFLSRYLPAVECTKCTLLLICLYLVLSKRLCISENGCTCDRNGKSA